MEKAKKARGILRSAFTRNCNAVIKFLSDKNLEEAQATYIVLEGFWKKLQERDSEIMDLMLDQDLSQEMYEHETIQTEEYEKRFELVRLKLENYVESIKNDAGSSQLSTDERNCPKGLFQLPPIKIDPFDGELKNWLPFWGQFEPIHLDETIATFHKFRILKQSMKPGSRAQQVVDSFPITKECDNYNAAVESLKERFGREHLLIDFYTRDLLQTIMKNAKTPHIALVDIYDKLECQLRFLELLGMTSGKSAAIICPMLESCMPEDFLRAWQRSGCYNDDMNAEERLSRFRDFVKSEVQNEQRISLAMNKFGMTENKPVYKNDRVTKQLVQAPSASGLLTASHNDRKVCIFCNGHHPSTDCYKAREMTLEDKLRCVRDKQCCYLCLGPNHSSKRCKINTSCLICNKKHAVIICPNFIRRKNESMQKINCAYSGNEHKNKPNETPIRTNVNVAANTTSCDRSVVICTLKLKLIGTDGKEHVVRAAIDTCAQRSYITNDMISLLKSEVIAQETLFHSLFQNTKIGKSVHNKYILKVSDLQGTFFENMKALGTEVICGTLPTVPNGPWIQEMKSRGINVSDVLDDCGPIELLIGGDHAGRFLTGNIERFAGGCITGLETIFGWTFMGEIPTDDYGEKTANLTTTMLISEMNLSDLWRLDLIGIEDPTERKSRSELQEGVLRHFSETVSVNDEGRYEVHLPWKEGHPVLPTNYELALKRLDSTEKKLDKDGFRNDYENVFKEWLNEGVIEQVSTSELSDNGHYLPHRHVVKLSSTTKIRPVFDASAHEKNSPSLNQCLAKGCNLVELIPNLLHRFRLHKIGIIADIRRAFLQISITPNDRKFLRFIWRNSEGDLIVYQHRRVVFGCTSSPFLLGAVIQHHLQNILVSIEKGTATYSRTTVEVLKRCFYVDNVVMSFNSEEEAEMFMTEATAIMDEGKFDLRGWELSGQEINSCTTTSVLGYLWDRVEDTLAISPGALKVSTSVVTKRVIASVAHKVFDPLGFTCPVTLQPKFLLKELWESKIGWDDEVPEHIAVTFRKWVNELSFLQEIKVPRWCVGLTNPKHLSLHVFTDACELSYAAVIFLRVEDDCGVRIQLVTAKSKIAPTKKMTIPRLELLAANIGSRLYDSIREHFSETINVTFWCDSTTVLAWIKRSVNWGQFVTNRVEEIKRLTPVEQWCHVPGTLNPADLPSRGCFGRVLSKSRWWEGPGWLYQTKENWPITTLDYDEDAIEKEKKKSVVSSTLTVNNLEVNDWYYRHFSNYEKLIRMVAWILRFIHNCRNNASEHYLRRMGVLSLDEIMKAECVVFKLIQRESFCGISDVKISSLQPFEDHDGIIRMKSKISYRQDSADFRYPIILPKDHPVVTRLLRSIHEKHCHVGVQGMLSISRERFWILGGRRTMKSVIASCTVCKRFESKRIEVPTPPLPIDRVREASAFEITGVDLAGPLYLKGGQKAWICIFTCGVVRAVHFELLQSLSSEDFILGLRRFVARRGRPSIIYSDLGTNFVGTNNLFKKINWDKVSEYCDINRISWKFNPATASWWGGWWERIVGLTKRLLRKVLKRTSLNYVEMETVLCDCESVLNARPLTYISDSDNEPTVITPSMFIQDIRETGMPELDIVETTNFARKLEHRAKLKQDLRKRFRNEYLGLLKTKSKCSTGQPVKVNDIVLIGSDNIKRLDWPIGKVVEVMPGKDNFVRVVRIKTPHGECVRPVQRLYRILEGETICSVQPPPQDKGVTSSQNINKETKSGKPEDEGERPTAKLTSKGRTIKTPKRFCD